MKIFPENSYSLVRGRQKWEYIFLITALLFHVTIFLIKVNKFGSFKSFSLSLHHEKGNH
nr:MAG TPA: hypothetical protein [Microviridae sp.]